MTLKTPHDLLHKLVEFIQVNQPLLVLTGAGCSTDSGIPDYRDVQGNWKYSRPVQYTDFIKDPSVRKRYWARSMNGWPRVANARPNPGHTSLAKLEQMGLIQYLITQNVDGLHQKAGTHAVLDLHGKLDNVICLECHFTLPRSQLQNILLSNNPGYIDTHTGITPDGDATLDDTDFSLFHLPDCPNCKGVIKPDVVFFGEQIPTTRLDIALGQLRQAKALLIVGSSLMVFSGYRFCKLAKEQGKPVAAINIGRTRADDKLDLKIPESCSTVLNSVTYRLSE